MGLDFSQKHLLGMALGKSHTKRAKRLQMYAFYTGLMSTMISLAHLILIAMK
ncbi:MAG: hypothetical protein AB199_03165 [Parcubacteria bacterium C7867-004]|nr:MAG: hypothetical protein AB199_03165 [Parcubacteria bacterium C7867-004]